MKGSELFALFCIGFIFGIASIGFISSVGANQGVKADVLDEYCRLKHGSISYYEDDTFFGVDVDVECFIEPAPEYSIETYIVLPHSTAYVWADGVVTCQEYIDKSHSFREPNNNIVMDEVLNPTNDSIYCAYKVEIKRDASGRVSE